MISSPGHNQIFLLAKHNDRKNELQHATKFQRSTLSQDIAGEHDLPLADSYLHANLRREQYQQHTCPKSLLVCDMLQSPHLLG